MPPSLAFYIGIRDPNSSFSVCETMEPPPQTLFNNLKLPYVNCTNQDVSWDFHTYVECTQLYSSLTAPFLSHSSHWSYLLPKQSPFYFSVFETKFYLLYIRENSWYLRLGVWLPVINMILSLQRVQLHSPLQLKIMPPSLHPFTQRWALGWSHDSTAVRSTNTNMDVWALQSYVNLDCFQKQDD